MRARGIHVGFRVIFAIALVLCIGLVPAVGTEKVSAQGGTVNIVIDADNSTAGIQNEITVTNGSQFTVIVWVQPQGGQAVSVVDARVDFDADYLSVDVASYDASQNIWPHPSTLFGNPVHREMDNINGYADYSDGTVFMGTDPTTEFPMFYIVFNADNITSVAGTQVTFHTKIPRKTDAFVGGNTTVITGNLTGITVKVMETPTVDFTIDPASGNITAGENVTFTSVITGGGPVENWAWDFDNDGTVDSTDANPIWNFNNVADNYSVNLTGTNTLGSDSEIKIDLITVNPDIPNKLAFNPAPATEVPAGATWTTFKVEIRDQYDNPTTSTDNVTVTPSIGTFASGNTTKAAVTGVATFDNLTYTTAGTITVTASSGTLTQAVSGNIVVSPDTPDKLAYDPAPATPVTAGAIWTTFKVEIRDQYDNLTTSTDNVTVTPSIGTFASGNTTKAAVAGVATFDNLTYTTTETITVTASSGTLTQAVSGNIVVLHACFIASASYDTPYHEDLDELRRFRDNVLMTNPLGRTLVRTYYATSPPIAEALTESDTIRFATRLALVTPLVYFTKYLSGKVTLIMLGILLAWLCFIDKKRKTGILKDATIGMLSVGVLTSIVFLLGHLGYSYSVCAKLASYVLPLILPVPVGIIVWRRGRRWHRGHRDCSNVQARRSSQEV